MKLRSSHKVSVCSQGRPVGPVHTPTSLHLYGWGSGRAGLVFAEPLACQTPSGLGLSSGSWRDQVGRWVGCCVVGALRSCCLWGCRDAVAGIGMYNTYTDKISCYRASRTALTRVDRRITL